MRNLFVFGMAAVCAVLIASNALATEKGGGGHGGGGYGGGGYDNGGGHDDGKDTKKYSVYVHNTDYHYGMAVWIKEKHGYGNKYMSYNDFNKQSVYMDPYKKGHKKGFKKGYYECWLFYSHDLHGYGYVSEYQLKHKKIDKKDIHVSYGDHYLYCDRGGFHGGDGGPPPT